MSRTSHFVVLFLSQQLRLQYLMQGLENCNTVQTCSAHVHKRNRIFVQALLQNYVPLNYIHILIISHFVVLFVSLQHLLQYLMQGFETCNTAQTCTEHVQRGNRILIQVIFAELCPLEFPLKYVHILIISHSSTVHVSATPPTVFDAGI